VLDASQEWVEYGGAVKFRQTATHSSTNLTAVDCGSCRVVARRMSPRLAPTTDKETQGGRRSGYRRVDRLPVPATVGRGGWDGEGVRTAGGMTAFGKFVQRPETTAGSAGQASTVLHCSVCSSGLVDKATQRRAASAGMPLDRRCPPQ